MAQAQQRESGYAQHPGYDVHFEPCPKRLRVVFNGQTVADSTRAQYLFETRHLPVYYFPRDDVRMDLLTPTEHSTFCPFKGTAGYFDLRVGERTAENAVWTYEDPFAEVTEIKDYLSFYWNRVDHWYEEDEEVFVHPRNPYTRIDIVASHRPVKVVMAGETVAETGNPRFLFETGLPTRYYIPVDDVRGGLLRPSETTSDCPYKGTARYWHLEIGGQRYDDMVWAYPNPVPEAVRIKDMMCFWNEHVDAIYVDGVEVPRPKTKWSRK